MPFEATSIEDVFCAIKELEEDVRFLDFGCGKGQILFLASLFGIKELRGVELVPDIGKSAINNLNELQVNADVIIGDAMEYRDIDDINVIFFNNPFWGDTL